MASYATAADMINRYDVRTLGDIVSDDGTRVASGGLAADAKMLAALSSATGKVKAAILRAERYTASQITNMMDSGHADYSAEGTAYLVDIVCAVAFWNLWRRKPYTDSQQAARKAAREEAEGYLKELSSGESVLDIPAALDSGTPKVATITKSEIETEFDLFVDRARGRFYPARRSYRQR